MTSSSLTCLFIGVTCCSFTTSSQERKLGSTDYVDVIVISFENVDGDGGVGANCLYYECHQQDSRWKKRDEDPYGAGGVIAEECRVSKIRDSRRSDEDLTDLVDCSDGWWECGCGSDGECLLR